MSDGSNGTVSGFSFHRRNYGHWDVCTEEDRIFAVRGGPGKYYVRDERCDEQGKALAKSGTPHFEAKTLGLCFQHICEELTFELLIVEGQQPHVIQSWNI